VPRPPLVSVYDTPPTLISPPSPPPPRGHEHYYLVAPKLILIFVLTFFGILSLLTAIKNQEDCIANLHTHFLHYTLHICESVDNKALRAQILSPRHSGDNHRRLNINSRSSSMLSSEPPPFEGPISDCLSESSDNATLQSLTGDDLAAIGAGPIREDVRVNRKKLESLILRGNPFLIINPPPLQIKSPFRIFVYVHM